MRRGVRTSRSNSGQCSFAMIGVSSSSADGGKEVSMVAGSPDGLHPCRAGVVRRLHRRRPRRSRTSCCCSSASTPDCGPLRPAPTSPTRQSVLPGPARRWDHRAADRSWDGHDRRRPSPPARTRDRHHQHRPSRDGQGVGAARSEELRAGGEHLRAFVRTHAPARRGCRRHHGIPDRVRAAEGGDGRADRAPFEGARLFVVPNPSGLNAHETTATIAAAYREPAVAAGVVRRAMASRTAVGEASWVDGG